MMRQERLEKLLTLKAKVTVEIDEEQAALGIRRRRRSRHVRPECGTEAGYQWHRYQAKKDPANHPWPLPPGDPCGCREAHAQRYRDTNTRPRKVA